MDRQEEESMPSKTVAEKPKETKKNCEASLALFV